MAFCVVGGEGENGSWRTAFSESATSLFERAVPVALRVGEKEEHVEELTVRILLGISKQLHSCKVLANGAPVPEPFLANATCGSAVAHISAPRNLILLFRGLCHPPRSRPPASLRALTPAPRLARSCCGSSSPARTTLSSSTLSRSLKKTSRR